MEIIAVRMDEPDIACLIGLLVCAEGDLAAVGRPIRLGGIAVPGRDAAQVGPIHTNDEDRVLVPVGVVPLEGESLPVRGPDG